MKIFKGRKGSGLSDEKAQKYGERIDYIKEKKKGKFKADDVLKDAKKKSSPLHSYFEWNNKLASNEWRLHQARQLVGIIMEVRIIEGVQSEQRSFFNVKDKEVGRVYVTVETALKEDDYRIQILNKIISHLENTTILMKMFKGL